MHVRAVRAGHQFGRARPLGDEVRRDDRLPGGVGGLRGQPGDVEPVPEGAMK
ncbi:hypothetical protein [Streptomyces caeruleatus]|uniref:hypothetical protein n=1 Tax=Streptomyces caeruleatus TaxID=661399 RepID=UPI000B1D149A|nr:hypothetical protein [Streptomyces caeruleatus]